MYYIQIDVDISQTNEQVHFNVKNSFTLTGISNEFFAVILNFIPFVFVVVNFIVFFYK